MWRRKTICRLITFRGNKMYIKRILSDLHISRKPLPFYILGLQLIQLSAVFQTEIFESKQWRKYRWIYIDWWFLIHKSFYGILLRSSCTITASLHTKHCGTANHQTRQGWLEYKHSVMHSGFFLSEQQIRGKIPFRIMAKYWNLKHVFSSHYWDVLCIFFYYFTKISIFMSISVSDKQCSTSVIYRYLLVWKIILHVVHTNISRMVITNMQYTKINLDLQLQLNLISFSMTVLRP